MTPEQPGSRILVVDDTDQVRDLVTRVLDRHGHSCAAAVDAADAREHLARERFDLVLCDLRMPGESGLELAEHVVKAHPTTAVVMATGVDDAESARRALELGAYGYVIKPFSVNEILISVMNALRRRQLELDARAHMTELERAVQLRTRELTGALSALRGAREETVRRLSTVAEYRDDDTGAHIRRVADYCHLLARKLGLADDRCELLRLAAPLHDVGKVALPDKILLKPGPLTPEERAMMERHAEIGYEMLSGSGDDLLDVAAILALTHHEHYDGTGYPRRLAGEQIPIEGRITAVADVFDAVTSDRVYRSAFAIDDAVALLRDRRGSHFDPVVLDAFLGSLDEVVAVHNTHTHPLGRVA